MNKFKMKNHLSIQKLTQTLTVLLLFTFFTGRSQVVDGINYQAVAIDAEGREIAGVDLNGGILHSKVFNVRFSIHNDSPQGTMVYQETHSEVISDNNGLFSLVIGHGEVSSSSLNTSLLSLNWGEEKKFLKVEFDLKKNDDYSMVAFEQLMAVPYAFYALNSKYSETSGSEIDGVTDNNDGTLTFNFSNGNTYTTTTLSGLSNGGDGQNALIQTTDEPSGINCATGGTKIEGGIDVNGNDTLDIDEINSTITRYVCNGEKGEAGLKGETGLTGPQGLQGDQGVAGNDGTNGSDGKSAFQTWVDLGNVGTEADFINSITGPKGDKGDAGDAGVTGPQGLQGDQGVAGNDGTNGSDGESAYEAWLGLGNIGTEADFINSITGPKGDKGDTGDAGLTGPQGLQGDQGVAGNDGSDGSDGKSAFQTWVDLGNVGTEADFINSITGPKGDKGDAGDAGLTGPQGLQGDQGVAGNDGSDGSDGKSAFQTWVDLGNVGTEADFINSITGPKGDKGDTGDAGLTGLQGLKGDQGVAGNDGTNGSDGESAYDVWLGLGNVGTEADFLASITGPKGDKGDTGDAGVTGPQGLKGDQGVAGNDGTNGINGTNGSDGESAYDVWLGLGNIGTEADFLNSITGPKGDKGDTGDAGLTGPQGLQGDQGVAGNDGTNGVNGTNGSDGESAYDVWLGLGNVGTEADFVSSLTGPQGAAGSAGAKGETGATGLQGPQGVAGSNGTNGTNGTHGINGTNGTNGTNGSDGESAYEVWLGLGNVGTEADFVSSLTGPQGAVGSAGAKGETGATGPQGPQGDAGSNGTNGTNGTNGSDGETAYEIWLGYGNLGTEADFLNALIGPQGVAGEDGEKGDAGDTGPQGIAGDDGSDGLNALIKTSVEVAGANCANGGTKIEAGLDANGNGALDAGEVDGTLTKYVCDGEKGDTGAPGVAGTNTISSSKGGELSLTYCISNIQVTFTSVMPDMNYILAFEFSSSHGITWVTNKTVNGFTLNLSTYCSGWVFPSNIKWIAVNYNNSEDNGVYPSGTVNCISDVTTVVDVTNPITGKTWMDRNLGASQVATSWTDADAYGDLYQFGRLSDGHQCRSSGTTSTLSNNSIPGHGDFILANANSFYQYSWIWPFNGSLWQSSHGTNNPCPSGYRIPTIEDWDEEVATWTTNDAAGAYGSVLKLAGGGKRQSNNGIIYHEGIYGNYWSTSIGSSYYNHKQLRISATQITTYFTKTFTEGQSVRCIKL